MSQKIKKKFIEDVIFTDITSEIDGKVAAEEAARIMGDSDLQDAVDAEQAARVAADSNLQSQIDGNDADIAALQSDLANLSGAGGFATDAELQAAVDALQADIDMNEADADAAIAAEQAARITTDANLQGQIDAEVSRATAAEEANATAISAEEARALAAEAALDGRINDMISNVDPAALDSFTEVVAAFQAADGNLQTSITMLTDDLQNELDATQAGAGLDADGNYVSEMGSNYIDGAMSLKEADFLLDAQVKINEDAIVAEESARQIADGTLQANIDQESMDRFGADQALQTNIDAEVSARQTADDALQVNITAEETARIAADSAEEAARIAADDLLRGVFVGGESYDSLKELNDAVVALEAASSTGIGGVQAELDATQAGAGLTVDGNYDPEVGSNYIDGATSFKSADSLLDAQVKMNEDAIAAYVMSNDAALAQEAADRIAADSTLQANIDIETGRIDAILAASDADKDSFAEIVALINSVDTENDDAFAAYVLSNDTALAQEVADRIAADSTLQANIDAEVSRATIAEGVLQTNIDQESMDRFAADEALDGRVTTLEGEMDSAESRLNALEAVAWVKEKFELVQADIDNGFITLSQSPVSGSESVFVGRLAMHEGAAEDYQVSGSQITFLNDLVGPGNQTLQVGDVIYVKYQA